MNIELRENSPLTPAHLLEADDVGVPQRAVVYDLPRHILVNLRSTEKNQPAQTGNSAVGARTQRGRNPGARTLSPLGMYFMATSSLVSLFRMSRATPKLPEPMSLSSSYLSIGSLARAGGWGWLWRGRRWGKGEGRIRSLTRRLLLGVRLL